MNNDLISREALKEHKFVGNKYVQIGGRTNGKTLRTVNQAYQQGWNDAIDAIIANAPTVEALTYTDIIEANKEGYNTARRLYERPQGDCENCDFRKFTETFVDGVVAVMNKNGITSLEQLSEILKGGAE